jgi:hypothetical protein
MPTNPYESPKGERKPAKNDWLAIVALLVIAGAVFYLALPTIQKINKMIDPPPPPHLAQ